VTIALLEVYGFFGATFSADLIVSC